MAKTSTQKKKSSSHSKKAAPKKKSSRASLSSSHRAFRRLEQPIKCLLESNLVPGHGGGAARRQTTTTNPKRPAVASALRGTTESKQLSQPHQHQHRQQAKEATTNKKTKKDNNNNDDGFDNLLEREFARQHRSVVSKTVQARRSQRSQRHQHRSYSSTGSDRRCRTAASVAAASSAALLPETTVPTTFEKQQARRSNSHNNKMRMSGTTSAAIGTVQLAPPTFCLVPKSPTDLLHEATDSLGTVGLQASQQEQRPQSTAAVEMEDASRPPWTLSSSSVSSWTLYKAVAPPNEAILPISKYPPNSNNNQAHSKKRRRLPVPPPPTESSNNNKEQPEQHHQSPPRPKKNPFQSLLPDNEDENSAEAIGSSSLFCFAPATTFAVAPVADLGASTMKATLGSQEEEDIDPDL